MSGAKSNVVVRGRHPLHQLRVTTCQVAQGLRRTCRQEQRRIADLVSTRRAFAGPEFLQHHVCIRPAKAEGIDRRSQSSAALLRHRAKTCDDLEVQPGEVDVRVRRPKVQGWRQRAILQNQNRLDQSCHARCGFQVAKVGLDRSDRQPLAPGAMAAIDLADGGRFNRVANRRTGAMRFNIIHLSGGKAGALEHLFQQFHLPLPAGDGDARLAAAVGVDARGENHGLDGIAVGQCPLQRLEQNDCGTLSAHIAVGRGVKGAAPAAGREH